MTTMTKQEFGTFALDFMDNLDTLEEQVDGDLEIQGAIVVVAYKDKDGNTDIGLRTSDSNAGFNLTLLTTAILTEHTVAVTGLKAMLRDERAGE